MASPQALPARFVALHVREQSVCVGAVDAMQRVVLTPRQVPLGALEHWLRQHLRPTDAVVVETPRNTWRIHDQLAPLVATVTIAQPLPTNRMPAARAIIDMARLHAAGLVPAIWVPSAPLRELRALAAQRRDLLTQRSAARNILHAILRRYRLTPPGADRLAADCPDWWEACDLAPEDRARVQEACATLSRADALLAEAEAQLEQRSTATHWATQVKVLLHDIPGMRSLSAVMILSEIGEIARFPSAGQLVGYAGLGASGPKTGTASAGRRELRATMLEIARSATRDDPYWQAAFDTLAQRIGRDRASVAIARKLLLIVWETLAGLDVEADAEKMRFAA